MIGGGVVQKWLMLVVCILLAGCSQENFKEIDQSESFVATVNILQPSVQFFNELGEVIADWELEDPFTGGELVGDDRLLLYGHQLTTANLYQLSTGKLLETIEIPIGTTNAYYDVESTQLFLANSETNELYVYNEDGQLIDALTLRNYPMSMIAAEGLLYVVNYKDTLLSIVDVTTLKVVEEWPIESSSHGLWIDKKNDRLWIGGHGEGTKPNDTIDIYELETGQLLKQLKLPMMPVHIASDSEQQAVVSHGSNMLYIIEHEQVIDSLKVSANPFAVNYFKERIIVAGYDDQTLYFIEDGQVKLEVPTKKGPFHLLTREVE